MNNEYDLETMQLNLNIKYLNNLINGCSKSNINYDIIKNELKKMDNCVENYTITEQKMKTTSEIIDISEKRITETETIDYLYLKPWSKLTQIHKVIKIKEFINSLDIIDQNDKENIKDQLINQIKEKKTKNKINYDDTKGKILSVSNLSFENNKYILN